MTEAARDDKLFGFCLATGGPGELVCLDSFYIGKLKGVGKVYQLSAIDVFTRWAIVMIVIGPVDHTHSIRFIDHILRAYRRRGVRVRAVLTDNGPEYVDGQFRSTWWPNNSATSGSLPGRLTTTPSASGSTQTILQECWRPAFHRRHFTSTRQLQAEADSWIVTYHHRKAEPRRVHPRQDSRVSGGSDLRPVLLPVPRIAPRHLTFGYRPN